jgi:prefoldin subunit 5
MGFSDSVYLIKERINNMSKEIRNTINTITHLDSMKAVKVALGLSAANQDSTGKVMEVVSLLDKNLKELATKVMKLEKKIEELETKEYERDLNERPKN